MRLRPPLRWGRPEGPVGSRWHPAIALLFGALLAGGCVDPQAAYEDFGKRPFSRPDAGIIERPTSPCGELLAKQPIGTYFASCLVYPLMDTFSLVFDQQVTTDANGTTQLSLAFTPLIKKATDIAQTTGDRVVLPTTTINEACVFDAPLGDLTLPANANTTMRDLLGINIRLRGRLLSDSRECAVLTGSVPLLMLDLAGDDNVCQFYKRSPGEPLPTLAVPGDFGCDPEGLPPLP
jgi:hypothetical protein